jgi:hypothetical protein
MFVCLKQMRLFGDVEWFFARHTAPRSSFALDLIGPLGATSALLGCEIMRYGSAPEPALFDAARSAQRGDRSARMAIGVSRAAAVATL